VRTVRASRMLRWSRVALSSRVARRAVVFLALPLLVAACASADASPAGSPPTSGPSAAWGGVPTPVGPSLLPSPAVPFGTPTATTPFDGVWATRPLARSDLAAALARHDLSDAGLDDWFPDSDAIDYRSFEIEIGSGRWQEYESDGGVWGGGWSGDLVLADADTIVARDDEALCTVTYDLAKSGDELSVHVAHDACPEAEDLPIQTAIYESSPFHLVQAAGWSPSMPATSPSPLPPMLTPSTSSKRQVPRPIGTVDGAPLGYLEYLPPDYGKAPSPLLVFLHGSGESGAGDEAALARLTSTGIPSAIWQDQWPDERPFVVLSPQHDPKPPSFCMEADEIDAFLRFALAHYDVDPKRVYLTGLSCGAIGLWNYLAAHRGDIVAAAVPIAGYGIGAVDRAGCDLARVPIWAFHGALDPNVPVRGDVYPISTLQACTDPPATDARVTVFPDREHDVWWFTYSGAAGYDIYAWLLGHHR
jgi:predicted esterase